ALEPSEELRQQVARMLGRGLAAGQSEGPTPAPPEVPEASPPIETTNESRAATAAVPTQQEQSNRGTSGSEPANARSALHNSQAIPQGGKENIALQSGTESPDGDRSAGRRSHGSALPK